MPLLAKGEFKRLGYLVKKLILSGFESHESQQEPFVTANFKCL